MPTGVKSIGSLPLFDPAAGKVIKRPEVAADGYWVGAPSAWVDGRNIYLSTRYRRPLDDGRGWKSAISLSDGGDDFEEIWACFAGDFDTSSIERSALVRAPSGIWRYYISYVDADRRWVIDLLEADDPRAFDPATRVRVLDSASTLTEGVKDPVVLYIGGLTYMFVPYAPRDSVVPGSSYEDLHSTENVFTTGLVLHPTGLWTSACGRRFQFQRDITEPGNGWDRNVARISSVVMHEQGFVIFYDGRVTDGDVYEDKTGVCSSLDLVHVVKHSVDGPVLEGPFGTGCLRYLECVRYGDELLYFYELGRDDGAHELRLARVAAPG